MQVHASACRCMQISCKRFIDVDFGVICLFAEGLEMRRGGPKSSIYGPVPTTIGCIDEGSMQEGDAGDISLGSAELSEMADTPWLPRDCR